MKIANDKDSKEFLIKYKELYAYYRKHDLQKTSEKYNIQEDTMRDIIWKYFLYKCFEKDECFYIDVILDCVKSVNNEKNEQKH